ncbi:MAG: 30S ribosomal protein S16, partial [Ignavibacteriae bacterium]|nr:30S ribosomal protein S16 [Ignavibacteriota bacterium]
MAVKLRLRRMGKKRQPIYKVVAADVRSPRDGKYIEAIGSYNPKTDPATVELDEERALYWLGVGAQPTTTVRNLLNKEGILLKKELTKQGLSEEEITAKLDEWNNVQANAHADKKAKAEKKKQEKAEAEKKKLEQELKEKEAKEKEAKELAEKEAKAAEVKDTASEEVSEG